MLIGVIYLVIENFTSYMLAKTTRHYHKLVAEDKLSDQSVVTLMNEKSDKTFSFIRIKILICVIMAILLASYAIMMYV